MTDKPDTNRDMSIRSAAIDMAIRSNCGQGYDEEGRPTFNEDWIVNAATKFENFIKGNASKSELQPKKEKEGW